jgi:hypothetical protein
VFSGSMPAGDVQQPRGPLRSLVEQFVEIAHAVEHQHVRVVGLDAQVLLHHRCVLGELGVVGHLGCSRVAASLRVS